MTEASLTITSLVDEVLDTVHGYSRHQDPVTALNGSMTSSETSCTVHDPELVGSGLLEVEDELMVVKEVDTSNGLVTLQPWGRAQSGTTAVSHADNARVTAAPSYPRQRVRNAIYGVLREIFPRVFGVSSTLLDGSATQVNFALPDDAWHVLRVETKLQGASQSWVPVPRWRQNKQTSTVALEVIGPVVVGTDRVRVQYVIKPPTTLASADDLTSIGYDYQIRDLVVLGATAKLLAFTESSRVQVDSMVAHGRAEAVPAGSATAAARFLYQMYQKRVEDEAAQLLLRYPPQIHNTR